MSLGSKIRAARELLGLSQLSLALRCGWESQSRIGNYEKDQREPSLNDLKKLAKALDRPITYFLDMEEENQSGVTAGEQSADENSWSNLTDRERICMNLLKALSETQQQDILNEIQAAYQLNEEIVAAYRKRHQITD